MLPKDPAFPDTHIQEAGVYLSQTLTYKEHSVAFILSSQHQAQCQGYGESQAVYCFHSPDF